MNGSKVLVRSRSDRMVAGVCAGLANYFNMDVTLVRVLVAAIAIVTGGAGVLAYLVAWALIPDEDKLAPKAEDTASHNPHARSG